MSVSAPVNIEELRIRLKSLCGLTIGDLMEASESGQAMRSLKGWFGQAVELALGANAGSESCPDFKHLGIELKTIPLNHRGLPKESTFVSSINLKTIGRETWQHSVVRKKLQHVLWLPVEGCPNIPFNQRRIGQGFFWKPNVQQEIQLQNDWQELVDMIVMGRLDEISARQGEVLQIRPKGANGLSLCETINTAGHVAKTLPRGFYLRPRFTATLL